MEKITEFLERYVEWIVLGLCVLFLGYMSYSYWIAPRSAVTIAGQAKQPDQINDAIINGPVHQIEGDLNKDAPAIAVKDHDAIFVADMDFANPSSAAIFKPLPSWAISHAAAKVNDQPIDTGDMTPYKVASLPALPAPTEIIYSQGRMTAGVEDAEAKLVGLNNGAVPAPAEKPAPKKKPADAAAAAGGAAAGGAAAGAPGKTKDIDWATVEAVISSSDLEDVFNSAFKASGDVDVPQDLFFTRILKVELHRQEKLLDGSWSKDDVVIPALEMYKMKEMPPASPSAQAAYEYLDWAQSHVSFIALPPFYDAVKGKPWYEPGDAAAAAAAAQKVAPAVVNTAPFDPAHPPTNRKLTPEERKAVADYKKAQRLQQKNSVGPTLPGGIGAPLPGGLPRPATGGKAKPYYQAAAPNRATPRQPGTYPGGYPNPGMVPGYGRAPYPGMMPPGYGRSPYPGMMPPGYGRSPYPGMPTPGQPFSPRNFASAGSGAIDVSTLTDDIKIWAHDDSVQPGKTYRYSIRYFLLNPVFGQGPNIQCDDKLKQRLWIQSPLSAWSDPIHISERVEFWLAKMTTSTANFEVFEWKGDSWTNHIRSVAAGDLIPGTSWTLVDLRKDPKGQYVLLVNESGVMERRDLKTDVESSDYQEMKDQVTNGAHAAAAGGA